jgi:hypothetical protein
VRDAKQSLQSPGTDRDRDVLRKYNMHGAESSENTESYVLRSRCQLPEFPNFRGQLIPELGLVTMLGRSSRRPPALVVEATNQLFGCMSGLLR